MNFKIVTADFNQEEEVSLNSSPKTLDKHMFHRDIVSWDLEAAFGKRESASKQSTFYDEAFSEVKIERLTKDGPWLSSCEEIQDCQEHLEKQWKNMRDC